MQVFGHFCAVAEYPLKCHLGDSQMPANHDYLMFSDWVQRSKFHFCPFKTV